MNKLTYKEAYDKIIQAYFKDEIKPMNSTFCFCGTLCDGSTNWNYGVDNDPVFKMYSAREFQEMENGLFEGMEILPQGAETYNTHPDYEDGLFSGMCLALEVLKNIHRERGENVDEVPAFTKRQLA